MAHAQYLSETPGQWVIILITIISCVIGRVLVNIKYFFAASVVGGSNDEDTHLILEYQRGDEWGNYTAPRANRCLLFHMNSFH